MTPKISVIVLNYNGKKFLEPCLSSLLGQEFKDAEIILVDNGSSDGSAAYVQNAFPSVRLVVLEQNRGFAGGTNAGIAAAGGEFILTLNNDTIAEPALLGELLKPMLGSPPVGMCAAKMLFPDGRIYSTGIRVSCNGSAVDRGLYEPDAGAWDREEEVFGPCAGAALYRRSMLDAIGLFDEDFFLYMEDVDLAFRARLSGWRCQYVPTARVIHEHGGTAGADSAVSLYYTNRNMLWCTVKNFPFRLLLRCSPRILWRNCADIPYYIVKGRGRTILRAKAGAVRGLWRMIQKRSSIQRKIPDRDLAVWLRD